MTGNFSSQVDHAARSLAKQVLGLRRRAANKRLPLKARRWARQEAQELYQRLRAILAAEREADPLLDDVSLEEIGITGEAPGQSADEEADEVLAIRLDRASGTTPASDAPWGHRNGKNGHTLAIEQTKKEITMYRPTEEDAMDELEHPDPLTVQEFEDQQEPKGNQKPKRQYRRKPAEVTAPTNGSRPVEAPVTGHVALDAVQLSKLWTAVTGGQITIVLDNEHPTFLVSLDSFSRALPVLLDRL